MRKSKIYLRFFATRIWQHSFSQPTLTPARTHTSLLHMPPYCLISISQSILDANISNIAQAARDARESYEEEEKQKRIEQKGMEASNSGAEDELHLDGGQNQGGQARAEF